MGIIGLGNVGQDLVKLLGACSILANDIVDRGVFARSNNVTMVDLHELIAKSDIISIHVPLNKSTKNMIGEMELSKMQEHCILINFARGGIVDEAAALRSLCPVKLSVWC